MRNREDKKKPNWASLIVLFLLFAPQIAIPLIIGYVIIKLVKDNVPSASAKTTYTQKPASFDNCPKKLFCFHKDKGEHHVARGREIDPWDRPDIDISKYQRIGKKDPRLFRSGGYFILH